MSEYIHMPLAVSLLLAVGWTTILSLTNKPGIRGCRNLGILACYVMVIVFLFIAGWKAAVVTWAVFGISGGVIYVLWEVLQRLRTAPGEEKPAVSLSPLVHGLLAWPIMIPEAVEYTLAELGVLRSPPVKDAEIGAGLNSGGVAPSGKPEGMEAIPDKPERQS